MKRALVTYSSSSEENDEKAQVERLKTSAKKRKLLPKLAASLTPVVPIDDPSKHQGRVRTQPFIDGQFAIHVYVPIPVASGTPLRALLEDVVKDIKEACPELHIFSLLEKEAQKFDSTSSAINTPSERITVSEENTPTVEVGRDATDEVKVTELHLSLSRPVFARSHQREDVKRAVKGIAKGTHRFNASFAAFAVLNNDERTRSFLTVEIGAGYSEFSKISEGLAPLLKEYRQPGYYVQPRYHISIAWILTTRESRKATNSTISNEKDKATGVKNETDGEIASFPEGLARRLGEKYASSLRELVLPIEFVCAKVGKQVHRWELAGF